MVQRRTDMGQIRPEIHGSEVFQATGDRNGLVDGKNRLKGILIQGTAGGSDPTFQVWDHYRKGASGKVDLGHKKLDGGLDISVYGNSILHALDFHGARMRQGVTVSVTNGSLLVFAQKSENYK